MNKAFSLDECFKKLIAERGWYKNASIDRRTASLHKRMFIEGRLSDEVKRGYLKSAGYVKVQIELWRPCSCLEE